MRQRVFVNKSFVWLCLISCALVFTVQRIYAFSLDSTEFQSLASLILNAVSQTEISVDSQECHHVMAPPLMTDSNKIMSNNQPCDSITG
jgi:hypothetical protein